MKDKNFILGVGCQKGGTTWLYSQLYKSKHTDMGFTKEYHIFDALYVKESRSLLKAKFRKLAEITQHAEELPWKHSDFLKQMTFYLDTANYYDYFDYLWYRSEPAVTTVGDITPGYAAIPPERLQEIKANLEKRGFNVKVIFLMRDPIERCWSMVRMQRKLGDIPNLPEFANNEQKHLRRAFKSKQSQNRTRYEITINNLESVFSPEQIFYGFYETLFEDQTINQLKDFLNLSDFEPDINYKVGATEKQRETLNEGLSRKMFDFYRDTYHFCNNKFGTRDIWSGWQYAPTE